MNQTYYIRFNIPFTSYSRVWVSDGCRSRSLHAWGRLNKHDPDRANSHESNFQCIGATRMQLSSDASNNVLHALPRDASDWKICLLLHK